MKLVLKKISLIILVGLFSIDFIGQVAPPPIPPPPPPGLPIDGSLWILLIGGICYAIIELKK